MSKGEKEKLVTQRLPTAGLFLGVPLLVKLASFGAAERKESLSDIPQISDIPRMNLDSDLIR